MNKRALIYAGFLTAAFAALLASGCLARQVAGLSARVALALDR